MSSIKLKPKARNGVVAVKALIKHPMETGLRKNKKTGEPYPAHYITSLIVKINGNTVVDSVVGSAVSKNPYFQFKVPGKKGDEISLSYKDNQGNTDSQSVRSK